MFSGRISSVFVQLRTFYKVYYLSLSM